MSNSSLPYLRESKQFFRSMEWGNPLSITCTLKVAYRVPQGFQPVHQYDCVQNLRHVLNQLNKDILGRRGKLQVVPVLEINQRGRFHFHLLIDVPADMDPGDLGMRFAARWRSSRIGHAEVEFKRAHDPCGWIDYMLKKRSKTSIQDAIDWENVHRRRA